MGWNETKKFEFSNFFLLSCIENKKTVGQPYNIQGYPTIKFFGADKTKPIDFDGMNIFFLGDNKGLEKLFNFP